VSRGAWDGWKRESQQKVTKVTKNANVKRDHLLGALAIWLGMLAAWSHAEQPWIERIVAVPYPPKEPAGPLTLQLLRQDYEHLQIGRSVLDTPLVIGRKRYEHGLGTHQTEPSFVAVADESRSYPNCHVGSSFR